MSDLRCDELFGEMVESVGVKAFAGEMSLSTRQIHRMLNGTQPNPVARFHDAVNACEGFTGDAVMDHLCRVRGGYFMRILENLAAANVNAVKESAEAIIAISEGRSVRVTIKEIREAIAALAALERRLSEAQT